MISAQADILPVLEAEVDRLKKVHTTDYMRQKIDGMVRNFRGKHIGRVFRSPRELLVWYTQEIVRRDLYFSPPPTILEDVRRMWRTVLVTVTERLAAAGLGGRPGSPGGGPDGGPGSSVIVVREQEEVQPDQLAPYLDLALALGADHAIKILVAANIIPQSQRAAALDIITEFLGDCAPVDTAGPGPMLNYPPEVLVIPAVRAVLRVMLSDGLVYQSLLSRGIDDLPEAETEEEALNVHRERIAALSVDARSILEEFCVREGVQIGPELQGIFNEIVREYEECADVELDGMITTITRRGNTYPVPSLRQRKIIVRARDRNQYAALQPDKGKTLAAIAAWRETNERRMERGIPEGDCLYIGPPEPTKELSNRIRPQPGARMRHEGYFVGDPPTVGRIERGITEENLLEELNRDMKFASYFMLHQRKGDRDVVEHILDSCDPDRGGSRPISCVILDEAHYLNGDQMLAHHVARLLSGIPDLYEHGRVMLLSASPITGDLEGFQRTLDFALHRPDQQRLRRIGGKPGRQYDIDELRLAALQYVPVLDPIGNWQEHITEVGFDLSRPERRYQQMIIDDDSLPPPRKMNLLKLFVLNPRLVSGNPNLPWTLMEQLGGLLDQYLEEANTVLITEDELRRGVTDDYVDDDEDDELSNEVFPALYRAIERHLQRLGKRLNIPVRFNVIHGDTSPQDRDAYFRLAEESQSAGQSKTVTFVMRGCVGYGINLSCYDRQIGLQHPWRVPHFEQLICRCLREDKKGFLASVLIGLDTFFEAKYWHAQHMFEPVQTFLYGHTLNEAHLGNIDRSEEDQSTYRAGGEVQIGTPLVNFVSTPERNAERAHFWLQNRGLQRERRCYRSAQRQEQWPELFVRTRSGLTVPPHTLAGAALLRDLYGQGILHGKRILDGKSHALALPRALKSVEGGAYDWDIESIVLYDRLETEGMRLMDEDGLRMENPVCHEGTMNDSARFYPGGGVFDAFIATEGFQNTRVPRLNVDDLDESGRYAALRRNERIQTIINNLHIVRDNGLLIYLVPLEVCTNQEWQDHVRAMRRFGVDVLQDYTGTMHSADNDAGDRSSFRVFVGRKVAMQPSERRDLIRSTLPHVSAESLQMTNVQSWSEHERRNWEHQHRERRLPYALLHHCYELGGRQLVYPYRPEERERHLDQLNRVTTAVGILRDMHVEGKDLANLPVDERETLRVLGVMHSPAVSSKKRPAFFFVDQQKDIYQILYPLDAVWNDEERNA